MDSVRICTEELAHVFHTVQALTAGEYIFVGKPSDASREGGRAKYRASQSIVDRLIRVHIMRFEPRVATLKETFDQRDARGYCRASR